MFDMPHGIFSIEWQNGLPRFRMPDKFERPVRWTVRVLTAIGILLSYPVFNNWRITMLVAVALVGLQQFLERTIFEFMLMYIEPMPDFELAVKRWTGMGHAFPDSSHGQDTSRMLDVIGPVFDSEEYARKVFDLFRQWNYDSNDDTDNNICVSFIFESDSFYSLYIYPNKERRSVVDFFEKGTVEYRKRTPHNQPKKLIVQIVMLRGFSFGPKSPVNVFASNFTQSKPIWLQPFEQNLDGLINIRLTAILSRACGCNLRKFADVTTMHTEVSMKRKITKKPRRYPAGRMRGSVIRVASKQGRKRNRNPLSPGTHGVGISGRTEGDGGDNHWSQVVAAYFAATEPR